MPAHISEATLPITRFAVITLVFMAVALLPRPCLHAQIQGPANGRNAQRPGKQPLAPVRATSPSPKKLPQEPDEDDAKQDVAAPKIPDSQEVDQDRIEAFRAKLKSATDMEDQDRDAVLAVVDQASHEWERSKKLESSARTHRELAGKMQQEFEAAQEKAAAEKKTPPLDDTKIHALEQLEPELAARLAKSQEAVSYLHQLEAGQKKRSDRRHQIAQLKASHASRLSDAEQQLAANPPSGESAWMTTARSMLQLAKLQALAVETPALRWELAKYDAEQAVGLPELRIETAAAQQSRLLQEVESLKAKVQRARRQQARSRYEELRDYAQSLSLPHQKQLALRNATLAHENEQVVADITLATDETEQVHARLETLRESERRSRRRVERIGMSGATGLDLRKQLARLPDVRLIRQKGRTRNETMRDVELLRLGHEETLAELRRQELLPHADRVDRHIHDDAIEILTDTGKHYDRYFGQLSELDFAENQLIDETASFREFLNQRVLWIRSNGWLGLESLRQAASTLGQLSRPAFWASIAMSLGKDAKQQWVIYGLMLVVTLLLMPARYRGRRRLAELGKAASRPLCTDYWLTLRAAMLTATIAMAWPLVLWFLGYRLSLSAHSDTAISAVGRGMTATAMVLAGLNLVRQACRSEGLVVSHFGWSQRVAQRIRNHLLPLVYFALPLMFIVATASGHDTANPSDGLLRLGSIGALALVAWTLHQLLHRRHGIIAAHLHRHSNSWTTKTHFLWFWIVVLFPVAMIVLIIVGYTYTAHELSWRFWHTLWVSVALVTLRAFAIRALQINHRMVRIEKLRQKREGIDQGLLAVGAAAVGETWTAEEEQEAIRSSGQQVLRVLHSGLWLSGALAIWILWSGIVPALSILDQWTLWDTTREVAVQQPLEDGRMGQVTETIVDSITLVNLLKATFLTLVTVTLVRNAPGLIDILILQRLPLDPSFKFAITMMCRYAILVVGILLIFSEIGFSWSKMQWLVAALTVGLGFGLQEIFGNFVSGIIILWERPVRIGDVVTLDGVSGTVSRIQMRATTISDWDRKEYIVPNKDFVTGRLLNWTRSDQVSRIVISVGVAYGCDVNKAMKILEKVATSHPRILADPPPLVTLDGFGDSTLDLTLRCFVPNLDGRLETISDLHLAINDQYTQAGIEIAFPPTRPPHPSPTRGRLSPQLNPSPKRIVNQDADGYYRQILFWPRISRMKQCVGGVRPAANAKTLPFRWVCCLFTLPSGGSASQGRGGLRSITSWGNPPRPLPRPTLPKGG